MTEENTLALEGNGLDPAVVDPARVEQQIDDKLIGERIRAMRLRRSMGLVELGRLTGLSASFLSQLETGRVVPTIRNLARIAMVFEKDLSCFFQQERKVKFRRLSKSDRIPITRKQKLNAKFVSESLGSLIPDRHIVPCLAEFLPNGDECEFTPQALRRHRVHLRPRRHPRPLRLQQHPAPRNRRRLLDRRQHPAPVPLPRRSPRPRPHSHRTPKVGQCGAVVALIPRHLGPSEA